MGGLNLNNNTVGLAKALKDLAVKVKDDFVGRIKKREAEAARTRQYEACQVTAQELFSELFQILASVESRLIDVKMCSDLQFAGWRISTEGVLYAFDVYTREPKDAVDLRILRERIMQTLAETQSRLIFEFGYEDALLMYPCIVSGLYVLDVQQSGHVIRIQVATHYKV